MKRINLFFVMTMVALGLTFILLAGCMKTPCDIKESPNPQPEMKQEAPPPAPAMQPEAAKPAPPPVQQAAPAMEKKQEMMEAPNLADIHFDFDKYGLRPGDEKILTAHAKWLMNNTQYAVKIEGNCDERGTDEYNMALGQRRADTAKEFLIDMGVSKDRISTVSYGKERPLDPGHNEKAWAKNRRDDFILSVSSL